jgi:hypothetical protein
VRGRRAGRAGWLATLALLASGAAAEEPAPTPAPPPQPAPAVELDRLYKLPKDAGAPSAATERVGSASKSEWRARFASARAERDAAKTALETAQKQLGAAAGETDPWQIAPPGTSTAGASQAPVSFSLREEIRRQREELARSERHLQDLTIEADLAGVPKDWRE